MIHPNTELKVIDAQIGYGVFATELIPAGTITYMKDALEIEISPDSYLLLDPDYQAVVDKYSYIDAEGKRILSWDVAKYVNHSCAPNSISTGYGFEIATRDILPGEEITDEYGIFNLEYSMPCYCGKKNCRKTVAPADFERLAGKWDTTIKQALSKFNTIPQPLMKFMDHSTHKALMNYLNTRRGYRSIRTLRYLPLEQVSNNAVSR